MANPSGCRRCQAPCQETFCPTCLEWGRSHLLDVLREVSAQRLSPEDVYYSILRPKLTDLEKFAELLRDV